ASPAQEVAAMRRFTLGSATDRKVVVIELNGTRMNVVRVMPDGSMKRTEQDLGSESAAQAASDHLANELVSRGYKEKIARSVKQAMAAAWSAEADERAVNEIDGSSLFEEVEVPVAAASTAIPRLAVASTAIPRLAATAAANPVIEVAPKKKKKAGGKKKRK